MCGFVAGNIFKNGEQFLESLSLLDHRGTDYKDHIFDANSGWWLGHNRLSIQGLTEESNQPITRKNILWSTMANCGQVIDIQKVIQNI